MASQQSTVDLIQDQIRPAGDVTARKMFGEYAIYCDGKVVALVCDDCLFVKPTTAGRKFAGQCAEASPYPGAKPCLLISEDQMEDADWLIQLVELSLPELPFPKKRKPRATRVQPDADSCSSSKE